MGEQIIKILEAATAWLVIALQLEFVRTPRNSDGLGVIGEVEDQVFVFKKNFLDQIERQTLPKVDKLQKIETQKELVEIQ